MQNGSDPLQELPAALAAGARRPAGTTGPVRVGLVVPGTRPALADIEARIMAQRGRVSLLYQVLLNSAAIVSGWESMLSAVRLQTGVPGPLRELIILRVAVLNDAPFEYEAHAPIALREGVSAQKIAALSAVAIAELFDPEEALVLALTDAMTRDVAVPDALMEGLKQRYDDQQLVELVATVAAYNMVSRFLVALQIAH
ncbi:carboxymuconolactone decarboxylase family protein [Massilia sp. DWR3-1-1]|uniref:carboxymuconolactone decarboxylase family protein n=1 Tax=Massilia sp. DWR3-1-1 TaxID=2804559 RepID=UPI003CE749B5